MTLRTHKLILMVIFICSPYGVILSLAVSFVHIFTKSSQSCRYLEMIIAQFQTGQHFLVFNIAQHLITVISGPSPPPPNPPPPLPSPTSKSRFKEQNRFMSVP